MALARLGVLVLNAGSSSLKASLIEPPSTTVSRTEASWGTDVTRRDDRADGVARVLAALGMAARTASHKARPNAVGYRVVHGGSRFTAPALIDESVLEGIAAVRDLAPLHNGVALETIEAGRRLLPDIAHVACFDTAFHATLAPEAYRYPIPEAWYRDWGIRRYGFHGLSVAWSVKRTAELLDRPPGEFSMVVAHLGSGCSVTAVRAGRSVDTSMGMTPLEGLMMGTRSGSIDPGIPLHLLDTGRLDAASVAEALDHESGLAAVSGASGDMRTLQASADAGDAPAALAIRMFVNRAATGIGGIATSLPRLDALVFTGGIGEHSEPVRRAIVARLGVIGLSPLPTPTPGTSEPDADRVLSLLGETTAVLRIGAREDLVIASQVAELLQASPDR